VFRLIFSERTALQPRDPHDHRSLRRREPATNADGRVAEPSRRTVAQQGHLGDAVSESEDLQGRCPSDAVIPVEYPFVLTVSDDAGKAARYVVTVSDPGVHTLSSRGTVHMGSVARDEDVTGTELNPA